MSFADDTLQPPAADKCYGSGSSTISTPWCDFHCRPMMLCEEIARQEAIRAADEIELRRLRERAAELEACGVVTGGERPMMSNSYLGDVDVCENVRPCADHPPDALIKAQSELSCAEEYWRELDSAIRREVLASDGCCGYHEDHSVHDDIPGDHHRGDCNGCVGDLEHHVYREPEPTIAAIQRAMKERLSHETGRVRVIDPKFHIEIRDGWPCIVKTSSGEVVPDWEPLMLQRARDHLMVPTLRHYRLLSELDGCNDYHLNGLDDRIKAFEQFATEHPKWMKQPGVTRGAAFNPDESKFAERVRNRERACGRNLLPDEHH